MEELNLSPLAIEVTNRCNMRCLMCVSHGAMWYEGQADGHPKHMDVDFFKSLVDQYIALEQTAPKSILPQFQGEPLLHPRFLEMCEYMQSKGMNFSFTTNASVLKKETSQALLDMPMFNNVVFSIDGLTKETYEKVRVGANYERVVENVRTFLELRKKRAEPIWTGISFTLQPENEHEYEPFIDHWVRLADSVSVNNVAIKGRPTSFYWHPEQRISCGDLWRFMIILTNGQAVPCCRDYLYKFDMGNLRESTLEEVWRGAKYQELRDLHSQGRWGEVPLCADCDTWMCRVPDRVRERRDSEVMITKGPFFLVAGMEPEPAPSAPVEPPASEAEAEPVTAPAQESGSGGNGEAGQGSVLGRFSRKIRKVVDSFTHPR